MSCGKVFCATPHFSLSVSSSVVMELNLSQIQVTISRPVENATTHFCTVDSRYLELASRITLI